MMYSHKDEALVGVSVLGKETRGVVDVEHGTAREDALSGSLGLEGGLVMSPRVEIRRRGVTPVLVASCV